MNAITDRDRRLTALFEDHSARVYAYACRQVGRSSADDLVADTYATALRRLDRVPGEPDALPWLLATARRIAANQRRRDKTRDDHWRAAVRDFWHLQPDSPEESVVAREHCLAALGSLSDTDRESLLLIAWDGLTPQQAAELLDLTRNAFTVRLHRARRRLDAQLRTPPPELSTVRTEVPS